MISFAVAPAKVLATVCNKCLFKLEKALNYIGSVLFTISGVHNDGMSLIISLTDHHICWSHSTFSVCVTLKSLSSATACSITIGQLPCSFSYRE
jgi:hypothetical protein